jgi:catabolite regulation protein CreA
MQRGSFQLLGVIPADGTDHGRCCEAAGTRGGFQSETSIFFKHTRIYRIPDVKHNAIVYLAASSKIIEGSPANSISIVPIMPWPKSP